MPEARKIFGAFIIAIALFFFWPGVIGSWQQVSALRAAVQERTQLLDTRTKVLAQVSQQFADYQAKLSSADSTKFSGLVPARKSTAELVSAIQDIAGGAGITVGDVRMSEAKSKTTDQFKTLSMTMTMAGTYASLQAFLGNLEAYVRLLNVQSIQVAADTRNPGRLTFSVQADTYFLQ